MLIHDWLRRHYVGVLALFIALGGTAYAATAPKNSVGSKSIRPGAVKSSDVKNNTIRGVDVNEATLDFRGLPQLVGPPGPRGEVGPTFATALANNDPAPPASPDIPAVNGQYTHSFVTPAAGRLLVFASLDALGIDCTSGHGNAFLYVDGVGVAGSGQRQPSVVGRDSFTAFALTDSVPAGEHTLTIALDCPTGNPAGNTGSGDGDLGALLIAG